MAGRIRSIKPEVLEDEVAAGLSDPAWRMWVSSWVLADDHGNLRAGTSYLAANVWQDTTRDADTPRQELIDKGLFEPYSVNGQKYVHVHAWNKHQRVDNASNPRVPKPEMDDGSWYPTLTRHSSEVLGEPPRTSVTLVVSPQPSGSVGEIPLARAPAHDRRETPISDPDHRPPTSPPAPLGALGEKGGGSNGFHPPMTSLPLSEVRLNGPLWIKHYQQAAEKALGRKWGFDKKQLQELNDLVGVHCPDKARIELWIDAVVPTFIAATKTDKASIWSSHQPRGLAKWLNEGGGAKSKTNGAAAGGHGVVIHMGKRFFPKEDGQYVAEDGSVLPGSGKAS